MDYKAIVITKETVAYIDRIRRRGKYADIGMIVSALIFDDEDTGALDDNLMDIVSMLKVGVEQLSSARERVKELNRQRVERFRERARLRDCNGDVMPCNGGVMGGNGYVNVNEDVNVNENENVKLKEKQEKEKSRCENEKKFDEFWKLYPGRRKVDKRKCHDKYLRLLSTGVKHEIIMAGLKAWCASDDWNKDGGQFVCAPIVWLNNERWETIPQKGNYNGNNSKRVATTANNSYQDEQINSAF